MEDALLRADFKLPSLFKTNKISPPEKMLLFITLSYILYSTIIRFIMLFK